MLDRLARLPEHNLFFCLRKCWRNPVSVMIDFVRIRTWRGLSEHHAAAMDRSRTAIPRRHVDPWAMVTLLALCWANCHQLCPSGCRHGGVHPVLWHKVQIPRVKKVVFVLARDGTIFCSCGPYLNNVVFRRLSVRQRITTLRIQRTRAGLHCRDFGSLPLQLSSAFLLEAVWSA